MYKKATYLSVVDYVNTYVKIAKLVETTSLDVILHLRSIFARYGIPETVVSDNGPQYPPQEFEQFAMKNDSYTTLPTHTTLTEMAKRNELYRPLQMKRHG